MNDGRIAEIRARLDAATPAPWFVATDPVYPQRIQANNDGLVLVAETYIDPGHPPSDAELIAHAPADLADLLAEVEALRSLWNEAGEWDRQRGKLAAELNRLTHLLGSDADGHRCTCALIEPADFHPEHMTPEVWEQDPWCPVHPAMEHILAERDRLAAENAALRKVAEAAERFAEEWDRANPLGGFDSAKVQARNALITAVREWRAETT